MRNQTKTKNRMSTTSEQLRTFALFGCMATIPMWILAWMFDSQFISVAAAVIATGIAANWSWKFLNCRTSVCHMLSIASMALVGTLNIGYLIAWAAATFGLGVEFQDTFEKRIITIEQYALAKTYVMAFATILSVGAFIPIIKNGEQSMARHLLTINNIPLIHLLCYSGSAAGIILLAFSTGIINVRSVAVTEEGMSPLRPFIDLVVAAQILINASIFSCLIREKRFFNFSALISYFLVAISLFTTFTFGRRIFVFSCIVFFIFTCFYLQRRPPFAKMLFWTSFALILLFPLLSINHAMRASRYEEGSAFEKVVDAFSEYTNEDQQDDQNLKSFSNYSRRPLMAAVLASCMSMKPGTYEYAFGKIAFNDFLWALPGVVIKNKMAIPKGRRNMYRHFPNREFLTDFADSLYLYSYIDFGWLGIFLYPPLVWFSWMIFLTILHHLHRPILFAILLAPWTYLFTSKIAESSVNEWFTILRGSIMFGVLFLILEMFFLPRLSKSLKKSKPYALS